MKHCVSVFAGALLLACGSSWGQDLAAVKEQIAARHASLQSYSADLTTKMNMGVMTITVHGMVRGKGAMRECSTVFDMLGVKMVNRTIVDAENIEWHEMDMMGETAVTKSTASGDRPDGAVGFALGSAFGAGSLNPRAVLEGFERDYDLAAHGREMLDDTEVFVIGGTLHSEEIERISSIMDDVPEEMGFFAGIAQGFMKGFMQARLYIGTADGFPRKLELLAEDGKPTLTQTFTNIAINQPIDDSLFAYTPPDGVQVRDLDVVTSTTAVHVGEAAPAFDVVALDGSDLALEDYKGKVVLLDFWAIWCAPCIAELPNLIALYNEYHPQGLELIGISLDGDRSKVLSFMVENPGMTWRQVFDGNAWESEVATLYGVESIPLTILIGKDGTIRALDLHGEELAAAVAEALAAH